MSEPTTWEYWGGVLTWLTRSGAVKHLDGQAFYPRTSVPPEYAIASHLDYPDVTAEPPPIDDSRCYFNPIHPIATFYLHFTDAFDGDEYTGLSIFQVNPRSRTRSYERHHTRLAGSWKNLECVIPAWCDYPFPLAWPCPTVDHMRIFARVYNRTAFLNLGPLTATPYP